LNDEFTGYKFSQFISPTKCTELITGVSATCFGKGVPSSGSTKCEF